MNVLIVLLLYQTVSSRFIWLDTKVSSNPQTMDDFFSDILNDMKLDISFDPPPKSIFNNNINTNSDIFSIPPLFQQQITPNTNNFQLYQTSTKPLFLMIDSFQNKPQTQSQNPSLFTLQQTNKVNGNTWRYTVTTNGNNRIITESWSTPKMYLCNSPSCGSQSGIEMIDILNNFQHENGQKYMHLVPATTMQMQSMDMDMDMDNNNNDNTWMDYAVNMAKGCHGKMKNWYYGNDNDSDDIVVDNKNENDEIIIDNSELLEEESAEKYKNDDILAIGMGMIMVGIIICGVLYTFIAWKYKMSKREGNTMNTYVAMKETDQF
eukprot:433826_1